MSISNSIEPIENESAKEYTTRLKSLLIQERGFPRSDDPFGPIDYVASILYVYEASATTHQRKPVRWGLVEDKIRDEFREKAKQTVASWAMEEIMASKVR